MDKKTHQIGSIVVLLISLALFMQGMAEIEGAVWHNAKIVDNNAQGVTIGTGTYRTISTGTAYVSTGFALALIVVALNILKKKS